MAFPTRPYAGLAVVLLVTSLLPLAFSVRSSHGISDTIPSSDRGEISKLPGWEGDLPSKHYSGYFSIPGSRGDTSSKKKHLHYYFVESENDPAGDPVVLWLNGGPGCSSLDGLLNEHGPFHVDDKDHSKLNYNKYTWTKVANILYLESPAGVGFSYADDPAEYTIDDDQTAQDNMRALELFFQRFPEFSNNNFYLFGESYAGIYVPTLAEAIMKRQVEADTEMDGAGGEATRGISTMPFNGFKGFGVGNGCIGNNVGACSAHGERIRADYCYAHGLVSRDTYAEVVEVCQDMLNPNRSCMQLLHRMSREIGNVNIYNVEGKCERSSVAEEEEFLRTLNGKQQSTLETENESGGSVWKPAFKVLRTREEGLVSDKTSATEATLRSENASSRNVEPGRTYSRVPVAIPPVGGPVECLGAAAASGWLNMPEVKSALHITRSPPAAGGRWQVCSDLLDYHSTREDLTKSVYPTLISKYRVLIYNGDADACVPYTDNEQWTEKLGLKVKSRWRPWTVRDQVAGYVVEYAENGFTFLTVRGAGHMVPQNKPMHALEMFKRYLAGEGF